ncbi:MAG TPA: hypothetical protein VFJ43_10695 [Bacteroidia bacterium]|nr:hypothetical protein [Bacteroidia bacterium]
MTAKELKRIFSKGECLSLDAMRLYNDGKLNKKSMHEVEKHLLECSLCSGAVDGLNTKRIAEVNKLSEHIQRRLAVYMNTPPRVSFFQRFGLFIIGGILLLGVGGTWLYLSQQRKENNQQITDSTKATGERQIQSFDQPNATTVSLPDNNQNVNAPVVNTNEAEKNTGEKKPGNSSEKTEKYPAELPRQSDNTSLTVKQEPVSQTPATSPDQFSSGPTTKSADSNSPVRVKSVLVYPPVTHNDKQTRKQSKDGQLGESGGSGASFEMDEMPFYPGGNDALRTYIINNFKPTTVDRSKLTRFATGVMFVVNSKTGAISSPELSFGISPEIDKELLRVISTMPNWSPGKKRGEVDIMVGITFE